MDITISPCNKTIFLREHRCATLSTLKQEVIEENNLTQTWLILVRQQKIDGLNPSDYRLPQSVRQPAGREQVRVVNEEDVIIRDHQGGVLDGRRLAERCLYEDEHGLHLEVKGKYIKEERKMRGIFLRRTNERYSDKQNHVHDSVESYETRDAARAFRSFEHSLACLIHAAV